MRKTKPLPFSFLPSFFSSLSTPPEFPPLRIIQRPSLPWGLPKRVPDSARLAGSFPLIYVYELPPYLLSWQYHHSISLDWVEGAVFLERLLACPHRTAHPEKAHFFFIPLILRSTLLPPPTLPWSLGFWVVAVLGFRVLQFRV